MSEPTKTASQKGASSKAKGRQHRKKVNYYKLQRERTLANKRRRSASRTRRRKRWLDQLVTKTGDPVKGEPILTD